MSSEGQDNCKICDRPPPGPDKNHGSHYGVVSCFNCKAFFKYCHDKGLVTEDGQFKTKCKKKKPGTCTINYQVQTKDKCKECRYLKCLAQGMDGSLILQGHERKKFTRKLLHGFKKQKVPAVTSAESTGSSSHNQVLERMNQVIDAYQASLDEIFVDFGVMKPLFYCHFVQAEWIEENSRALLKMLNMHASMIVHMMSKLDFFAEVCFQDRVKLIEKNAHLYIQYTMAKYFTAHEGISQLSWLFGSKTEELLEVEDLLTMQERSFIEANQWGHIIPLSKDKRLTIFSNCIEAIQRHFQYPQFFNGLLGYFTILTTDHWLYQDKAELTNLSQIKTLQHQAKEMIALGWNKVDHPNSKVGTDQLQNLIDTLQAMSLVCDPASQIDESGLHTPTTEVCTLMENHWIECSTKVMKKTFREHQIDSSWMHIFFDGSENKFDSFIDVMESGMKLMEKRFEIILKRHGFSLHPLIFQQAWMFTHVICQSPLQLRGHISWLMGTDDPGLTESQSALISQPNWQIYNCFNAMGAFVHKKREALKFQEIIEELMTFLRLNDDVGHLFMMSILLNDNETRCLQMQYEKVLVKKLAEYSGVLRGQSGDEALRQLKSLFLEYVFLSSRLLTDIGNT